MHHNKQIAIIVPDMLQSIGLQTLLADYFSPVEITHFQTFESFSASENEHFDYYFTHADGFIQNADFFLPRRNKTMLLIHADEHNLAPNATNCLTLRASQETILEQLKRFLTTDACTIVTDTNKELATRETDVLQLIVKGSTNKEIADRLNISLNTVLTHRKNITSKLGIKTVSGLTFYAIMHGLVSGEEIGI